MDIQFAACLAHQLISLLNTFPQQFLVCRITHLALIARRIRVHRIEALHIRLPHPGQFVLQLLDLQFPCKLQRNVIQQLVVRQRTSRIYHDVAEHLVEDVAVQRLHQLREAHLRLHLQEHQRHFSLRREVRSASTFGAQARIHKSEASCHLVQREDLLHPAQFSLLKCTTVLFIKIVLREWEIRCNLSKISYLRHTNFLFDSSEIHFPTVFGGIFLPHIKDTKIITHYQSNRYKVFKIS